MPFLLDGDPTQSEISEAINYLLSNFSANITSDPVTGQIAGSNNQVIGYLYKYMSVKYADSFDGSVGFSNTQTNKAYYGLRNSNSSIESTNYTDYVWYKVTGGFGTTKTLYYKVTGGRSIEFQVATSSPGYAWVPDTGAAIDLDALTMAFTVNAIIYKWGTSTTPARPTSSTTYTWATNSYTAPSGWSTSVPSGGSAGNYLWSITIGVTQTGGIETSTLDWTNVAYPIVAVGINGQNGTNNIVAYLVQSQASPTPAFSSTTTGPNAPSGWSLATPAVAVGQVLWYIQGQYNSSTTDTVNGVPPNTTAWTGPIAASIFQDIRSDNWDGGNPPTAGNPATYGTQGYYIQRSTGSAYLNNLFARGEITVGSNPAISGTTMTGTGTHLYSDGRMVVGNSTSNLVWNNSNLYIQGNLQSYNYSSGSTGWQILNNGSAEFNGPVLSRNLLLASGTLAVYQTRTYLFGNTMTFKGATYYDLDGDQWINTGVNASNWGPSTSTYVATGGLNANGINVWYSGTPGIANFLIEVVDISFEWLWSGTPTVWIKVKLWVTLTGGANSFALAYYGPGGIDWNLYKVT